MSMKQHFRSAAGCCICATKSSTSRFVSSSDYESHFVSCFGIDARRRSGVICNACVLCVKRHKANPEVVRFLELVDTRKGPGPKNIKQINKRKKHKELRARRAALASSTLPEHAVSFDDKTLEKPLHDTATFSASSLVNVTGAVLRSATAAAAAAGSCSAVDVVPDCECSGSNSSCISTNPSFRVPQPPSLAQSPNTTLRNYYKKRVIMCPMKMPDSDEIDELYQEVRKRKQNLGDSFDMPQIHHAMMTQKRRLMLGSDGGSVTSSTDSLLSEVSITNAV